MNEVERNSTLAIILSFLVLAIWWSAMSKKKHPRPEAVKKPVAEETTNARRDLKTTTAEEIPIKKKIPREEGLFELKTKFFRCLIGRKSGRLRHLFIKENSGEIDLILPDAPLPFAVAGGDIPQTVEKKNNAVFAVYRGETQKFSIDGDYLKMEITPAGETPAEIAWSGGIGCDPELIEQQQKRRLTKFYYKNGKVRKINKKTEINSCKWIGITNRYFLIAFFPQKGAKIICDPKNRDSLITFKIPRRGEIKILPIQKRYTALLKRGDGLQKTINFGLFSFLSVFFLYVLNFFNSLFGNYGWATILLTVIIQIFMFPLTKKNLKSAQAMKRIQPYVKKLQQQYKDDPKRLNAELLNLYKVQKVNPLGGCLPMILQIPIFWSLFTMLQNTFELRGAPFILWIKDLSRPDMLFGHIPSFIPIIGNWPIGPLPLLMGAVMFLQQKMTITDPQQKAFLMMPIFFTFIFLKFPSGLVLYWFTSNVITFIEQVLISRQNK
ncbi:MAG: membrane protein insertase YidC [Elusimicrobia bacterium]|nr:membrane protein insertase YidC [Elusimicrobiota bacterium]